MRDRGTLPVTFILAAVIAVGAGQARAAGLGWVVDAAAMAVVMSQLPRMVAAVLEWWSGSRTDFR